MGRSYTIREIVVYPVKACKGLSVPEACFSSTGLLFDREWMVVSADNGRLIAQAAAPKLALVKPSLPLGVFKGQQSSSNDVLEIDAPGMHTLKIPLKRSTQKVAPGERGSLFDVRIMTFWAGQGIDEGPEAAAWWSTYLGRPARLVRFNPEIAKRQVEYAPDGYLTGFTNIGQFLFASEESLQDLNRRVGDTLQMNRFRPNIIVRGPSPFEEDKWRNFQVIHEGEPLVFTFVQHCARCKVPTIDQGNPIGVGEEPIKIMRTFRSGNDLGLKRGNGKQVFFGTYFVCDETIFMKSKGSHQSKKLSVGDAISILEMVDTNT